MVPRPIYIVKPVSVYKLFVISYARVAVSSKCLASESPSSGSIHVGLSTVLWSLTGSRNVHLGQQRAPKLCFGFCFIRDFAKFFEATKRPCFRKNRNSNCSHRAVCLRQNKMPQSAHLVFIIGHWLLATQAADY